MVKEGLVEQLKSAAEFFERSTRCLAEEDSNFSPSEDTYTVVNQVAHVAQTIDWFIEGMFKPEGFDLDFDAHTKVMMACTSLTSARQWFDRAIGTAIDVISSKTDQELLQPLPPGPVMGGAPRSAVVGAIADHTAHHRGALTVYSRLLGKVPLMPYME